jgi:hypothetical protein
MSKGEKRICSTCNKFAEVLELIPSGGGWYIQKLSCSHTGRIRIMDPIEERIEITEKLESNVIKFRTLTEGPIIVSDDSGTSVASGSIEGIVVGRDLNAGSITFNTNTYNFQINTSSDIDNFNTNLSINNMKIQNIFSMVDDINSYSPEEKEQIKSEIRRADKIIKSIGKVSDKALPYIQLLVSLLQKSG